MSNKQLYIIIVRCEQRDGPPRPSAHHVTGRLKNALILKRLIFSIFVLILTKALPKRVFFSIFAFILTKETTENDVFSILTYSNQSPTLKGVSLFLLLF